MQCIGNEPESSVYNKLHKMLGIPPPAPPPKGDFDAFLSPFGGGVGGGQRSKI